MEELILTTLDEVVKLLKEVGQGLEETNKKLDQMQSSQKERQNTADSQETGVADSESRIEAMRNFFSGIH